MAGPNTVLLIGNEMRTALDHFVSEARQLHSGADCASSSPLNSGLSQDNKECLTALRSETSQCELAAIQTFEWSFRDLQIKDLEVFEGDVSVLWPLVWRLVVREVVGRLFFHFGVLNYPLH